MQNGRRKTSALLRHWTKASGILRSNVLANRYDHKNRFLPLGVEATTTSTPSRRSVRTQDTLPILHIRSSWIAQVKRSLAVSNFFFLSALCATRMASHCSSLVSSHKYPDSGFLEKIIRNVCGLEYKLDASQPAFCRPSRSHRREVSKLVCYHFERLVTDGIPTTLRCYD